ncbi:hypothetical protein C6496_07630 [Candidatus Poribacteria bacterium]|nr:MAG: hypothetical protein C6496_07630 [Candidatus Poribacteria bacterium]
MLLFGCGSDETLEPMEVMPNYFPDAVGSQWVYLYSDGIQGTTEVSQKINIDGKNYRTLKETPPNEETDFDLLKPVSYRVTENQILFAIGGEVDHYVQNEIPALVQNDFAGLDLSVTVESIPSLELVFLQFPPSPSFQWNALNMQINGSIILQNIALLQFPFEVVIRITGAVVAEGPLETLAGNFENAYQLEYQTKITQTLFSETKITEHTQTIWFVPHVGIAKTENELGWSELIAYSVE